MRASLSLALTLTACGSHSASDPQAGAARDAALLPESADAAAADGATRDAASLDASQAADAGDANASVSNSEPLDTPLDTWTFLPIAGARCGNGTATGIGVNRSNQSADLVIMLEGGGACWDGVSCFGTKSAVHIEDAYDQSLFQSEYVAKQGPTVRDPNNPLSVASLVLVPYCTGDLHAGDTVRDYDVNGQLRQVHHVGALNMEAALTRLRKGLPAPRTIWLMGSSAGGFGATLNLQAVERTFPEATVHMLADSAPLLTPQANLWQAWKSAWNLRLPEGCTACEARFGAVIDALAQDDRHGRIGLMAYDQDATIGAYFGFDGPTQQSQLAELFTQSYAHADTRYFLASGTGHVLIISPATTSAQTGVVLQNWLISWILGVPAWLSAP
jgi:hypothetical protein